MIDDTLCKLRLITLITRVNELEAVYNFLENQKFLLTLGMKCEFDDMPSILQAAEDCLVELKNILGEIRYIKRMSELEFEICMN